MEIAVFTLLLEVSKNSHHSAAILTLNPTGFCESQKHADHFPQYSLCVVIIFRNGKGQQQATHGPVHISQLPGELNKILQVISVQQTGLYSVVHILLKRNVDKQGPRGNMNITDSLSHFPTGQGCTESKGEIQ